MFNVLTGENKQNIQKNTVEWAIELKHVVKLYITANSKVSALRGIDLRIHHGDFITITGKSGSGKTTLVNMMTGLDHLTDGEVWLAGAPLHEMNQDGAAVWRRKNVGIVFQSFQLLPGLSVLQNVMLPLDLTGSGSMYKRRERCMFLLEQMGIAEHAGKKTDEVSGGQQQRIAIARALANDPPMIVADEPTGSLDSATRMAVFSVFEGLAKMGKTVIIVTHDRDLAARGWRIIRLADGLIEDDRMNSH